MYMHTCIGNYIKFLVLYIVYIKLFEMRFTAVLSKVVRFLTDKQNQESLKTIQELAIKYAPNLQQSNATSPKLWEDMQKHLIELKYNPASADLTILQMLKIENNINAAKSFYNFLQSNKAEIPVSIACKYMELYVDKEDKLSATEKDYIYSICNEIIRKYTTYDKHTTTTLVKTLCRIDKWMEAAEVIKSYELYNKETCSLAYCILAMYHLNHGCEELGYQYTCRIYDLGIVPTPEFYDSYFFYCLKEKDRFIEKIEKLFDLWRKYGVKPTKDLVSQCMDVSIEAGLSAEFSSIKNGKCNICKQQLLNEHITNKDFEQICIMLKKLLYVEKVNEVPNSKEIDKFVHFIDERKPYDVIIDGTNAYYSSATYSKRAAFTKLVMHLKRQNMKILFIGKRHLFKFLQAQQLMQYTDHFLVDNMANDDIFVLYAAFSSKKSTKIVTKDLLRNHEYSLMSPLLKANFKKWLMLHQYSTLQDLVSSNATKGIDSVIQKDGNYWHIPYMESSGLFTRRHVTNYHWVCLNTHP